MSKPMYGVFVDITGTFNVKKLSEVPLKSKGTSLVKAKKIKAKLEQQ